MNMCIEQFTQFTAFQLNRQQRHAVLHQALHLSDHFVKVQVHVKSRGVPTEICSCRLLTRCVGPRDGVLPRAAAPPDCGSDPLYVGQTGRVTSVNIIAQSLGPTRANVYHTFISLSDRSSLYQWITRNSQSVTMVCQVAESKYTKISPTAVADVFL